MQSKQTKLLPILSNDPSDRIVKSMRRYDRNFNYNKYKLLKDYPPMDDYEALTHYFRGVVGRIIDMLIYVDFGVGFKLKHKGFSNDEAGIQAVEIVEKDMEKRNYEKTIRRAALNFMVLSRCAIVKTRALDGSYYYSKQEKVTGYDAISPVTLGETETDKALKDTTGTAQFMQYTTEGTIPLDQDRVIYLTYNDLTEFNPMGSSPIQRCTNDLRTLAGFPTYRERLARLYSEMFSIVKIDTAKITSNDFSDQVTKTVQDAQNFLDDTAEFYRDQMDKGGVVAVFDWEEFEGKSWAGKEVKLQDLEIASLDSVCTKFGIPMPMLRYAQLVNRDTLPALTDTFIRERENGLRKSFYTYLTNDYINDVLAFNGITEGIVYPEFNPFLSKDYLQMSQIIANLYPTGSITNPEIRDKMDLPDEINRGGEDWDENNMMPNSQNPSIKIVNPEIAGNQVNNRPVDGGTIQASLDLFKQLKTNPYYDLFE